MLGVSESNSSSAKQLRSTKGDWVGKEYLCMQKSQYRYCQNADITQAALSREGFTNLYLLSRLINLFQQEYTYMVEVMQGPSDILEKFWERAKQNVVENLSTSHW